MWLLHISQSDLYIYYNIFSIVTTINTHSYARYSRKIQ